MDSKKDVEPEKQLGLCECYEKVQDHGTELFICFVEYEKALDRVNWVKMIYTMKQLGVDWPDRLLIWEL